MIELNDFITQEMNNVYCRSIINEKIAQMKINHKINEEITFNIYSIEIDATNNKITIINDVDSEVDPLIMDLEYFIDRINRVKFS